MLQDLRYAIRQLRMTPGFALTAILTLAIGIGANATIFSIVDWLLLRQLPVHEPAQLTSFWQQQGRQDFVFPNFSVPDYRDVRSQSSADFDDVCAYELDLVGLSVNGRKADRVVANYVTGNYFQILGLKPALGRLILPTEGETPGSDPVIVLSYSYWQKHLGGDPSVIGTKVLVNNHPVTVVGVAPEGFHGTSAIISADGYLPLGMGAAIDQQPDFMSNRDQRSLFLMGRLRHGVSLQQAQATIDVVAHRLSTQYPESHRDLKFMVFPEARSRLGDPRSNGISLISLLFLGLAGLVLLLACVNVANILLVRVISRSREIAIRAALGAGRGRLVRQLLTESVLLALMGGVAGILLGWQGSAALGLINLQTDLPIVLDLSFDWRVFGYALAAALFTGAIVGVLPALRASRGDLAKALHEGGRGVIGGRQRLRTALVVVQVAGSLMLLIIAGLFTRSLSHAQQLNLGFDPTHVANMTMDPAEIGYTPAQSSHFYKELLTRVRANPNVISATTALSVPLGYYTNGDTLLIPGYQPAPGQGAPLSLLNYVSTDYFNTLRIPLLAGRDFSAADEENAPFVAIVNESLAKRFWPKQEAVGREFKLAGDTKHTLRVVGVAKDARYGFLVIANQPYVYLPAAQHVTDSTMQTLQVRTGGSPETVIPELEQVISGMAPDLPVFEAKTMTQALYTLNGFLIFEVGAGLAAALGGLGLILSVVGVYGVISYAASQRTHEIGIRMALGAKPEQILRMIFRQGIVTVGLGLLIGLVSALAAAQVFKTFLTVSTTDPLTYIAVPVILAIVALAACAIPAMRAMRVDPMIALRYE
jgi:putative ABC transport system permease protein